MKNPAINPLISFRQLQILNLPITSHQCRVVSRYVKMYSSICVLLSLCLVSVTFSMDPHQLEMEQVHQHSLEISARPCHTPQVRVIPVHELVSKQESYGKAYFPDVTMLHRCDDCVGYCTPETECVAKVKHWVRLPFKATYTEDFLHNPKGSWVMEFHEFVNHTECHCAKKQEPCHH